MNKDLCEKMLVLRRGMTLEELRFFKTEFEHEINKRMRK